jgi:PAS domain S-box-containing protein
VPSLLDICRTSLPLSPDPLLILERERVLFANPAAADLLGAPGVVELEGVPLHSIVHESCWEVADAAMERLFSGRVQPMAESKFVRFDGSEIDGEVTFRLVPESDPPIAMVAVRDITVRKQIEAEWQQDDSRLEALLRLSRMDVATDEALADFVLGQAVRLTRSEAGYLSLRGSEGEPAIIRVAFRAGRRPGRDTALATQLESLAAEAVAVVSGAPADGPMIAISIEHHLVQPLRQADRGAGTLGVVNKARPYDAGDRRQVTLLLAALWPTLEKRRVERQNVALIASLAENNQQMSDALELRASLMRNFQHELRTPLAQIRGYGELLAESALDSDEQITAASVIVHQADAMAGLVDGLLQLVDVRQTNLIQKSFDLSDFLRNLALEWQERQRGDLKFVAEARPGLRVKTDPQLLTDALNRVLENAAKFSPEGGEVRLEAQSIERGVRVAVHDQGIGLNAGNLERIFEPFYQVDPSSIRAFGGVGIGLTIARRLIEASGGRMWAESEGESHGSSLYIDLPQSFSART